MPPTKTDATSALFELIMGLQEDMRDSWKDGSIPKDWHALDSTRPIERAKTRVTIRLDAEMVNWFRKLGPGYQRRLNDILMIYWLGVLSGRVKKHADEVIKGGFWSAAREIAMGLETE